MRSSCNAAGSHDGTTPCIPASGFHSDGSSSAAGLTQVGCLGGAVLGSVTGLLITAASVSSAGFQGDLVQGQFAIAIAVIIGVPAGLVVRALNGAVIAVSSRARYRRRRTACACVTTVAVATTRVGGLLVMELAIGWQEPATCLGACDRGRVAVMATEATSAPPPARTLARRCPQPLLRQSPRRHPAARSDQILKPFER